jgi:hypothetical protein
LAYHFVDRSEDLLHLPDLGLVLEVDRRVEVGDLLVDELRHRLAFAGMKERCNLCGGQKGEERRGFKQEFEGKKDVQLRCRSR